MKKSLQGQTRPSFDFKAYILIPAIVAALSREITAQFHIE